MKKFCTYIVICLVGIVLGWLCRGCSQNEVQLVQRDVVVKHDTITYTKTEFITKELPPKKEYVYVEIHKTDTVYRDSIQYVMMPREYYYTKVKDAEIWHSGVQSSIDSLNVFRQTTTITEKYVQKEKKNFVSAGIEAGYSERLYTPIYLKYERMLHKNIGIYGRVDYDIPSRRVGAFVGAELEFGW